MAKDPICGMTVDAASALSVGRDGQTYCFCSDHCRQTFLSKSADTKRDENSATTNHKPQAGGSAIYTYPMHPEVQQDHPGDCPKCGMTLEPKTASQGTAEDNAELRDMTLRFWIGAALTVPVFLLAMAHMIPVLGQQAWVTSELSRWIQFVLTTPVVWWAGGPFFVRGWRSVVSRHLNMFTLITIGVGAAFVFSAVAMLLPGLFPDTMQHAGKVAIYFEAAAMVTVLVLLGQVLELRARSRSGSFVMQAERVGSDTLLGQIVNMVAKAQRSRAPIQGLADKVAGIFVPVVLAVSVLTFVAWMWIGPEPKLAHAIINAAAVLIFAFLYNALGIPVAAGVLYPFFGLLLSPIIAGAAMSLSSVSVISNALRLRRAKL